MSKLKKQLIIIFVIIMVFCLYDFAFYELVTKRSINKYGNEMNEKSIKLSEYLPFDEDSLIVHASKVDLELDSENLPILDGATALFPIYSSIFEAIYPESSVEFDGSDFTDQSYIRKTGTTVAYKNIVDGTVDMIFCAGPSENQLQYAEENNVELEFVPIGYEAFVFIVNSNNSVDNLTVDQIKNIYSGEYTNWKEVGGENKPIIALQRAEGSGSQTAMLNFMNGIEMKKSNNILYGRCIGYSFRYYVESIVSDTSIKMLSVNGVYPNEENVRNGQYPIVDTFYVVYRKNDLNENIQKIVDYILSNDGQNIINQTGYVGIN